MFLQGATGDPRVGSEKGRIQYVDYRVYDVNHRSTTDSVYDVDYRVDYRIYDVNYQVDYSVPEATPQRLAARSRQS